MDIQLKLTNDALKRIFNEGEGEVVVDYLSDKLLKIIETQVLNGLDLRGLYISNVILSDKIKAMMETEVGNYLRINDYQIRGMIKEEIEKQTPKIIESAVQTALEKQKKKILENLS